MILRILEVHGNFISGCAYFVQALVYDVRRQHPIDKTVQDTAKRLLDQLMLPGKAGAGGSDEKAAEEQEQAQAQAQSKTETHDQGPAAGASNDASPSS